MGNSSVESVLGLTEHDQVGLIRKRCVDNNIVDINDIACACESLRKMQIAAGYWCYENYTETGSHSVGVVRNLGTQDGKNCVIWPINHYLGLNRHPDVIGAAVEALQLYGTGCGTSAMSGGHNSLHKALEDRLANILRKEAAILFPTGYSANLGAISALTKSGNAIVFFDRECHASIIDGMKLAGCKFVPFIEFSITHDNFFRNCLSHSQY